MKKIILKLLDIQITNICITNKITLDNKIELLKKLNKYYKKIYLSNC